MRINIVFGLILGLSVLIGCSSDEGPAGGTDNFDRASMLANWADNIIIPAYTDLDAKMKEMSSATDFFVASPDQESLDALRTAWLNAYISWQKADLFEIGKAEQVTMRNYLNVFPLDVDGMTESLLSGAYDLESVNRQDEQGFSAMDYLIHGLADTDAEIIAFYTDPANGGNYKIYISDVSHRMEQFTDQILLDWNNGYRDTFVSQDGTSGTSSVNTMVNNYLFYYEKFLRAGKIGIPAGVFSGSELSDRVEARFRGDVSKELFLTALQATQDFFNGVHYNGQGTGISLKDYLDELNTIKETEDLSALINNQFNSARTSAANLSDDLGVQVENDNTRMLETYDELQKNVILLKVDMFQALGIQVDFVDADGD